jgi:anti-sigma factor RsiW
MSDRHVRFEMLCVRAVGGELTQGELAALRSHTAECSDCKDQLLRMEGLNEEMFLACALAEPLRGTPRGMSERFVERANREGIPLRSRTTRFNARYTPLISAFVLVVVTVCIASTWRSSVVSISTVANRSEMGLSRGGQILVEAHRTPATGSAARQAGKRGGHRQRTGEAGPYSARNDADVHAELKASRLDFVMYSPQPKFSSYSIPSASVISGGDALKPWLQREPGAFGRAFLLKNQKLLLEASSDSQQQLTQYAALPNGTLNFRFNPSDYREPQDRTH